MLNTTVLTLRWALRRHSVCHYHPRCCEGRLSGIMNQSSFWSPRVPLTLPQALLLSPRNSIEGQLGLLRQTSCTSIALPSQRHESVSKILDAAGETLKVLNVPELEELLLDEPAAHYPYVKTWDEAWQEPLFVSHTSGTTGVPKTVVFRHGLAGTWDAVHRLSACPDGTPVSHRFRENQAIFCVFPLYHVSIILSSLQTPTADHRHYIVDGRNARHVDCSILSGY